MTPFFTSRAFTSLPGLIYALSSKLIIRLLALFSSLNMSSLHAHASACYVLLNLSHSVLGGFFEQNDDFPQCAFAALGLRLFITVAADFINFFFFRYKL